MFIKAPKISYFVIACLAIVAGVGISYYLNFHAEPNTNVVNRVSVIADSSENSEVLDGEENADTEPSTDVVDAAAIERQIQEVVEFERTESLETIELDGVATETTNYYYTNLTREDLKDALWDAGVNVDNIRIEQVRNFNNLDIWDLVIAYFIGNALIVVFGAISSFGTQTFREFFVFAKVRGFIFSVFAAVLALVISILNYMGWNTSNFSLLTFVMLMFAAVVVLEVVLNQRTTIVEASNDEELMDAYETKYFELLKLSPFLLAGFLPLAVVFELRIEALVTLVAILGIILLVGLLVSTTHNVYSKILGDEKKHKKRKK